MIFTTYHNYRLLQSYRSITGKDRALFGIHELLIIEYKIYIGIALLISLTLLIIGTKRKESKNHLLTSLLIFLISTLLLCLRPWTYFI